MMQMQVVVKRLSKSVSDSLGLKTSGASSGYIAAAELTAPGRAAYLGKEAGSFKNINDASMALAKSFLPKARAKGLAGTDEVNIITPPGTVSDLAWNPFE